MIANGYSARSAGAALAAALAVSLAISACVYLPRQEGPPSQSLPAEPDAGIADALGNGTDRALIINEPLDALHARLDMIDTAEHCLDLQYFIWQNDQTGILLVRHLLAAADRGVRVRVLLDDIQLQGLVDRLNALNDHPNVEIRIFNPFSVRLRYQLGLLRLAEFAIDGNRLNHRMHNKLLVADNHVAVLGGRNIGDDYYGFSPVRTFVDSDLLISGRLVPKLSTGFDRYWNSRWAYPVSALVSLPPTPASLDKLRARIDERLLGYPELLSVTAPAARSNTFGRLRTAPRLTGGQVVVDDPDVSWGERPDEIAADLTAVAASAAHSVLVVSPYVVLSPALLDVARSLTERGVSVKVLTNSLASNDVVIAHAAYARFRRRLIEADIELFEFRHDAAFSTYELGGYRSLHSKYIVFDDAEVFVGSLNLDPRSLYLNTELGVVLSSPALAQALRREFETMTHPDNAWRVSLREDGLSWSSSAGVVDEQPARGEWQRARAALLGLLPLSSQL